MVERRLTAMIRALHDAGVEFLIVGGLSAVLNGAPVNTMWTWCIEEARRMSIG
jgi:hypothetical protein